MQLLNRQPAAMNWEDPIASSLSMSTSIPWKTGHTGAARAKALACFNQKALESSRLATCSSDCDLLLQNTLDRYP